MFSSSGSPVTQTYSFFRPTFIDQLTLKQNTRTRASNETGVDKTAKPTDFYRPINRYISKTTEDKHYNGRIIGMTYGLVFDQEPTNFDDLEELNDLDRS